MSQFIGIDLFAGAGGMTLGAFQAGINVKLAVENDFFAAKTFEKNFKQVRLFNDDIRKYKENIIKRSKNDVLIVFGGPPCQGFSTSNQRTRNNSNHNNWLFEEFIRVIKLNRNLPDWIVFENVKGFSETENGDFLNAVLESLNSLGYTLSFSKLNAVDFNIPQRRTRFFIVGSLHGLNYEFPKKINTSAITVKDAIQDLPILETGASDNWMKYSEEPMSKYAKLLRGNLSESSNHLVTKNSSIVLERYFHIPQGGNWKSIPSNLMLNYKDATRCHTGIYHRLNEDLPSIVIGNFRKNMLIHPTQHRGLSVREAARLQSFPDYFEFVGGLGDQQQQVGNAVPPLLAKAVFEKIISYC